MKFLKSKKFLVVLVIVAVIVAIFLFINRSKKVAAPAISTPTTAVVEMGEGGFTPETLKIKSGTTVVFKNSGAERHQIASNPHPEHSELPDLDSKTAIAANGTYTYKFTKAGTFHYHNELQPDENGTIIVE